MTTETKTQLTAVELGWQRPFTVQDFTLRQLSNMKTAITNSQAGINQKRLGSLAQSLAQSKQIEPISVGLYEDEYYLIAGRNRICAHIDTLNRPLDSKFSCLVYEFATAEELTTAIVLKNDSRSTRTPEKKLLVLSGELGKAIGEDSLLEHYAEWISGGDLAKLKNVFCVDVAARLINELEDVAELSETLLFQLVPALFKEVLNVKARASIKNSMFFSAENMEAMISLWVDTLPSVFKECISKHPSISSWSRDGKDTLTVSGKQSLIKALEGFSFPKMPVSNKPTSTKAKPSAKLPPNTVVVEKLETLVSSS